MPLVSGLLDVAVSDDVPENQAPNASPNDREVFSDCIYGRPTSNPEDGCQGYTANNAHENRPQEVVGSSDETTDEPAHGANASDDCERLPDLSVKEHQGQTSGAGLPFYESRGLLYAEMTLSSITLVIGNRTDRPAKLNGSVSRRTIVVGPRLTT